MTTAADELRVGGLTPLTTVDYPGELAAVVYCQGCPWRCRYCHNGHLLEANGGDLIPWADVVAFIKARRGLLDAVVFSGGEPTAQAGLQQAVAEVRALGFKTGLHTGGPYPERLERLLPGVDWIALDIKALPEDYPLVTGIPGSGDKAWRSLELLIAAGADLEVRTTPMPGLDDPAYLERLMDRLVAAGVATYALQQYRPAQVSDDALPLRRRLNQDAAVVAAAQRLFPRFSLRV
jgi:pyruvate formate lyase activating enzyme